MDDSAKRPPHGSGQVVGAYEAKTKFSELIARAARGESFVVTKNGRPVARITPPTVAGNERAREAAQRIRELLAVQGPPVSVETAQRNWQELKADIERDRDARADSWFKS